MPTALITGITGQDGSYLAELLLAKGYRVAGTTRDSARAARGNLAKVVDRIELLNAALDDDGGLRAVVRDVMPDEIYNLAGQTQVSVSWQDPVATGDVDAIGVARLVDAVRAEAPGAKIFQASSCDIFEASEQPLDESSRLGPSSPYGVAKAYGHLLAGAYRRAHGMFIVSGVLFNHESPRRGVEFVTRKITRAVAAIAQGKEHELRLGNLDSRRDWGFAGDYVEAMWLMLQQAAPDDFVIGTGHARSVRDFCDTAFGVVGLNYRDYVVTDQAFVRESDVAVRVANAERARTRLGWTPTLSFHGLVKLMVDSDISAD